MRITLALLAVLFSLGRAAHAQDRGDDRWQVGLDSGGFLWDIRLVRLTGDSLVYRQADSLRVVSVERIRELRLIRKSEMRMGEGAGAGGAMNALLGGDDEVYDLVALDFAGRIRAIQQIFLVHPPASP